VYINKLNKPEKGKWAKLTFVFRAKYIFIKYEDGAGNKVEKCGEEFRIAKLSSFISVRVDHRIDILLTAMLDAEPRQRITPYGEKKIPLAIFVDQQLDGIVKDLIETVWSIQNFSFWQIIFAELLQNKSYQLIHQRNFRKWPTFQLPLRISILGNDAPSILADIEQWQWLNEGSAVKEFGLQLNAVQSLSGLKPESADIVIISGPLDTTVLRENSHGLSLRLVILISLFDEEYNDLMASFPTSSILVVRQFLYPALKGFLKELLYGIIHDYSLHEAVNLAIERGGLIDLTPILYTGIDANHSLRMVDGLDSFKQVVDVYAQTVNPGDLSQFISKLPSNVADQIGPVFSNLGPVGQFFTNTEAIGGDFGRETSGLVPLSKSIQYFKMHQQPRLDEAWSNLKPLVNTPEIFDVLRQTQRRVVDATLDQLADTLRYVRADNERQMLPGGRYRLNINIGQPSTYSLMVGDVDTIDPLLPDPDHETGNELEVVVFPKDLILRSSSRKTILLPLLGGSTTARFLLEVPYGVKKAQLRFGIFRKNFLLQAFILEASVGENVALQDKPAITVKMDASTSASYGNLDNIAERDFYIGLNAGNDGSHSLFLKGDTIVREVHGLNESLLADAQKKFSELLNSAYFSNGSLRFPMAADTIDKAAFFKVIRDFAKVGSQYYHRLFSGNDKDFKEALAKLRKGSDFSFQIVRHDVNYSFPWPLIYDYYLVPPAAGQPDYPVCMGETFEQGKFADFKCDGEGCPHNPNIHAYCIEGFWGFRHRIEQLLPNQGTPRDIAKFINGRDRKVLYSINFRDGFSEALDAHLQMSYPVQAITHDCDWVELLWSEKTRPAALVVFGHLETNVIAGEPEEPRILTFPRDTWPGTSGNVPLKKWLYHQILINKVIKDSPWTGEPLPLVFLISCFNATMTLNSLNSLVEDFNTAGASAIIGTECDITSDLGAAFIKEMMTSLYTEKKDIGEAIQAFNQNRFRSYNPLAFVFTCFGNSNLKII